MFLKIFLILVIVIIYKILSGWCFPLEVATNKDYGACTTSTYGGKCVALQDCASLFKVFVNLKYLPQRYKHKIKDSQCGFDDSAQDLKRKVLVCCPHIDGEHSMSSTDDLMLAETVQIDNLHCGLANKPKSDNKANVDHYPWMALIEYVDTRGKN